MTPGEFMERLESLFSAGRYRAALDFASAAIEDVAPRLRRDERERMHGMMDVAARIVDLDQAAFGGETTRTA